jgi:hypothetical protein
MISTRAITTITPLTHLEEIPAAADSDALAAPTQKKMDDGEVIPQPDTHQETVMCLCCVEWFFCVFSTG